MENNDAEARRRRAAKLRDQIAGITGKKQGNPAEPEQAESTTVKDQPGRRSVPQVGPASPRPVSPRDFIERRMRELDQDVVKDTDKGGDDKT